MLKIYQLRLRQNTFDVILKYKGISVHVEFTDGNTYNGTPAKYTTTDPFKQAAIENSQLFKDNDITLERAVNKGGEPVKAIRKSSGLSSRIKPMATPVSKQPATPKGKKAKEPVEPVKEAVAEEPIESADANATGAVATETADQGTTIEFPNLAEAILYIAQTWQLEVQTEAEARRVLKEHGITPRIKKG